MEKLTQFTKLFIVDSKKGFFSVGGSNGSFITVPIHSTKNYNYRTKVQNKS